MTIMDKVKSAIGKAINPVQQKLDDMTQNQEKKDKLTSWKKKLSEAMSEHDKFRSDCAVWDALYHGTRSVGPNISRSNMSDRYHNTSYNDQNSTADARQVHNITFQLVESQIDISVLMPNVEAIEGDDDNERKLMIEGYLTYLAEGPELERITSENERIAKKNSLCVYKVDFDPDFKSHKFRGRIRTVAPHPINVIPQPGVYRVKDMDYLFHIENRTIDRVCRMYGEEFRDLLDTDGSEYSYLEEFTNDSTTYYSSVASKNRVSVVECWYKDKDGDVCLLVWANDVILKDMPKFFYKRVNGKIIEMEEIEIEQFDDAGNLLPPVKVQVKAHVPTRFPFVIQYNIPKEKSYYGKADPDIIYDQQEGIKKLLSIEEEKQILGTTKIFVRRQSGLATKLSNAVSQIIETDDPHGDLFVVDLKTPDQGLKQLYGIYVQAAKDTLGVTEASQGRADGSTLSGRALEILANNTAGRISVKIFEKQIAFTELYQLYYDFVLAFIDDARPYRVQGKDNRPQFGYFDKSKLLKQDDSGEWYYPEFDIKISVDSGLPKDKRFILETANQSGQRMDNIEYWMVLESVGFPNASAILEREQQKEQQPPPPPPPDQGQGQGVLLPGQPPAQQSPTPQPTPQPPQGVGGKPPPLDPVVVQVIGQNPQLQQALQALPPAQLEAFFNATPQEQTQFLIQLQQQMGGVQNGQVQQNQ